MAVVIVFWDSIDSLGPEVDTEVDTEGIHLTQLQRGFILRPRCEDRHLLPGTPTLIGAGTRDSNSDGWAFSPSADVVHPIF